MARQKRPNQVRGERSPNATLTEKAVMLIRSGQHSDYYLANRYGVSHTTIRYARIGLTWAHLP